MTVISWMSKLQISLLSKLFSGKIDCLHNISLCARKNEIFMYCIMNQWGIKILGRVSGLWKMKNCHYSISVNRCLWSVGFANLDLCHRRNISYTLKLIPAAAFRWGKYSCKDLIYSSILWLFTSSLKQWPPFCFGISAMLFNESVTALRLGPCCTTPGKRVWCGSRSSREQGQLLTPGVGRCSWHSVGARAQCFKRHRSHLEFS